MDEVKFMIKDYVENFIRLQIEEEHDSDEDSIDKEVVKQIIEEYFVDMTFTDYHAHQLLAQDIHFNNLSQETINQLAYTYAYDYLNCL